MQKQLSLCIAIMAVLFIFACSQQSTEQEPEQTPTNTPEAVSNVPQQTPEKQPEPTTEPTPEKAPETVSNVLFQDDFQTQLDESWSWVRENPDAHKIENGLKIKLEPGGLMGGGKNAKNILIRPLPEKAKLAEVHVKTEHQSQYEQAGLILYHGDDHYIKFVEEHVDGQTWLVVVVEVDANAKVVNKIENPKPGSWLSMEFYDTYVSLQAWDKGWDDVKSVAVVNFQMDPKPNIGVFTQSGQPDTDRWVVFKDFSIYSENPYEPGRTVEAPKN